MGVPLVVMVKLVEFNSDSEAEAFMRGGSDAIESAQNEVQKLTVVMIEINACSTIVNLALETLIRKLSNTQTGGTHRFSTLNENQIYHGDSHGVVTGIESHRSSQKVV